MSIEAVNSQLNQNRLKEQLVGKAINQGGPANQDIDQTRLKGAIKDLEALFIYEMLKEMRQTTQGGILGKGMGGDIYSSLFDMEVAKVFAERGIGLGDLILKQMTGREGNRSVSPSSSPKEGKTSFLKEEIPPVSLTAHRTEDKVSMANDQEFPLRLPVDGRISSPYGWRDDPFSGQEKFHAGIDIATPSGQEVYPVRKGRVIFSGLTTGYGNAVVIDHEDGFVSKYGHNSTNLVSVGDAVNPDQAIALTGNTGNSTGPHLHFEVQYKGKKVNPLNWVRSQQGAIG
jgi:murein DD-endopeptidase MepM/ murein hydrolase activator NlpD